MEKGPPKPLNLFKNQVLSDNPPNPSTTRVKIKKKDVNFGYVKFMSGREKYVLDLHFQMAKRKGGKKSGVVFIN